MTFNYELAKVTGVFKDLPANTHLKFDILFSYRTLYARGDDANERYNQSWEGKDMYTFVELRVGTDPGTVEAKFPALVEKYKPQLKQSQQKNVLSLQPLKDIHLKSDLAEEAEANGSDRIVLFMGMIGIFVLIIAWINYVNLSTARALERAKEVGIRKAVGAFKKQLIIQFMVEAAVINMLSAILAWGMTAVALPYLNTIAGISLTSSYLSQRGS
jgi:putative ABC transport system permease protein